MLTRWYPQRDLTTLDRFFDDLWGSSRLRPNSSFVPSVDVEEHEDHFLLHADLPGVDKKNIEVTVQDGVLKLAGTRESSREEKKKGLYLRERCAGRFERSFRLGDAVVGDKVKATYKDGVLSIRLPKREDVQPRQIPVSTN